MTTVTTAAFFILIFLCGATDILYGKIFNYMTLPALGLGLLFNGLSGGLSWLTGLEASLLGAAVGFIPLYIVFRMGGMGGGDVKLMAGIGSLMGFPFVVWALFYSILVGGAMAMLALIREGRFLKGMKRTGRLFLSLIVPGLEPLPPEHSLTGRVPFGLAIALGSLWAWVEMNFL